MLLRFVKAAVPRTRKPSLHPTPLYWLSNDVTASRWFRRPSLRQGLDRPGEKDCKACCQWWALVLKEAINDGRQAMLIAQHAAQRHDSMVRLRKWHIDIILLLCLLALSPNLNVWRRTFSTVLIQRIVRLMTTELASAWRSLKLFCFLKISCLKINLTDKLIAVLVS